MVKVAGTRFALSFAELSATDGYEAADYVRRCVELASGTRAWVYVGRDELLKKQPAPQVPQDS